MLFILLLIAAVALIVLAPFKGAVALGVIALAVICVVWLLAWLSVKSAWKRMDSFHDDFWNRHH